MERVLLFLVGSLLIIPIASALLRRQHLAQGTIVAIDNTQVVLILTSAGKDTPAVFAIKTGRTRLRESGRNSSLENLKEGQRVRVYYRKEMGTWVATDVSWNAASPPQTALSGAAGRDRRFVEDAASELSFFRRSKSRGFVRASQAFLREAIEPRVRALQ